MLTEMALRGIVLSPTAAGAFPVESPIAKSLNFWKTEIVRNPSDFLEPTKRFRTAFGNGVVLLNDETFMANLAGREKVNLAGVEFTISELMQIGKFYQFVASNSGKGICMDERVGQKSEAGIHKYCGAASAIGKEIGVSGKEIEDLAIVLTGESKDKAEVYDGMEDLHESSTILLDLSSNLMQIKQEKAEELRESNALAFQTHIPLNRLSEYQKTNSLDEAGKEALLTALLKFNLGIATEIILGSHNKFSQDVKSDGITLVISVGEIDDISQSRSQILFYVQELANLKKIKINLLTV